MRVGKIENISTREDFLNFIRDLHDDLKDESEGWKNTNYWQNPELGSYLGAMEEWVQNEMDDYFRRIGETNPEPSWRLFAEILFSAATYE